MDIFYFEVKMYLIERRDKIMENRELDKKWAWRRIVLVKDRVQDKEIGAGC